MSDKVPSIRVYSVPEGAATAEAPASRPGRGKDDDGIRVR